MSAEKEFVHVGTANVGPGLAAQVANRELIPEARPGFEREPADIEPAAEHEAEAGS